MSLGERLKILRGTASQEELSKQLDVSKAAIGAYERNSQMPGSAFIVSICEHFNIEHRWLLTGEGPMHPRETVQPTKNVLEPPVNTPETVSCSRCAEMKAELDEERKERRELAQENRKLLCENGELKVKCAVLEERQKHCGPEPQVFKKLPNIPPSKTDLRA